MGRGVVLSSLLRRLRRTAWQPARPALLHLLLPLLAVALFSSCSSSQTQVSVRHAVSKEKKPIPGFVKRLMRSLILFNQVIEVLHPGVIHMLAGCVLLL